MKTQQRRYEAVGSIVKLSQHLSLANFATLELSEKLDTLDILGNEALMAKPIRQVVDEGLKMVQATEVERSR
jgi:hypothetical protein